MKTKFMSFLVVFLAVVSCAKADADTLIVGTNAEFPPFEYIDNGEITGFDIELIQAVAKELGKDIQIENLSWEGLLPALQSKKVDLIIAGMTATEDRKKVVNFSDTYYIAEEQMIVLHENTSDINSVEDLVGKKVGVVLGFTGDIFVSDLEGVNVERYNGASQAIVDLQNGKIDAMVLDNQPAQNYVKNAGNLKSVAGNNTQEEYSIAIRQEDKELLADVNDALKKVKASGTFDAILNKYFPEN